MTKSVKKPVATPPYLKQVRIRDYAPLRDAKVDFKPGLNIIIGSNGAGKTRFLSLTNELADPFNGRHLNGLNCEIIIAGAYEIKIRLVEANPAAESDSYALTAEASLVISASYETETIEEYTLYAALENLTDGFFCHYSTVLIKHGIPSPRLPIIDEGTELVVRILRKKIVSIISFDSASKNLYEVESRLVQGLASYIMRGIRHGLREQNDALPMTGAEAREIIAQTVDAYLELFNLYLPLYSPIIAVRRSEYFQVYRNSLQDEFIIKGLVLEYQVGDAWLSFSALSDGTKRLFYVITELLSPLGTIQGQNRIIFLEEPELGIHPAQLTKLLNLIREVSKDNQVIMTTHSPQVLDMLTEKELDRITICTLDAKKGTQFHKLTQKKQKQAREYMQETGFLSDYWRYSFLEETEA